MLGLGYPGGIVMDRLARAGDPRAVRFPRALPRRTDLDFSFSGLKTAVSSHLQRARRGPPGRGSPTCARACSRRWSTCWCARRGSRCGRRGSGTSCSPGAWPPTVACARTCRPRPPSEGAHAPRAAALALHRQRGHGRPGRVPACWLWRCRTISGWDAYAGRGRGGAAGRVALSRSDRLGGLCPPAGTLAVPCPAAVAGGAARRVARAVWLAGLRPSVAGVRQIRQTFVGDGQASSISGARPG